MLERIRYPRSPLARRFPSRIGDCCGRLPSRVKYASSVRRILCKKESIRSVDVVTIRDTGLVEDNRLEADVYSGNSGMNAIDRHAVLRGYPQFWRDIA